MLQIKFKRKNYDYYWVIICILGYMAHVDTYDLARWLEMGINNLARVNGLGRGVTLFSIEKTIGGENWNG